MIGILLIENGKEDIGKKIIIEIIILTYRY